MADFYKPMKNPSDQSRVFGKNCFFVVKKLFWRGRAQGQLKKNPKSCGQN